MTYMSVRFNKNCCNNGDQIARCPCARQRVHAGMLRPAARATLLETGVAAAVFAGVNASWSVCRAVKPGARLRLTPELAKWKNSVFMNVRIRRQAGLQKSKAVLYEHSESKRSTTWFLFFGRFAHVVLPHIWQMFFPSWIAHYVHSFILPLISD